MTKNEFKKMLDGLNNEETLDLFANTLAYDYSINNENIDKILNDLRTNINFKNFDGSNFRDIQSFVYMKLKVIHKLLLMKKLEHNIPDLKVLVNELRVVADQFDELIEQIKDDTNE